MPLISPNLTPVYLSGQRCLRVLLLLKGPKCPSGRSLNDILHGPRKHTPHFELRCKASSCPLLSFAFLCRGGCHVGCFSEALAFSNDWESSCGCYGVGMQLGIATAICPHEGNSLKIKPTYRHGHGLGDYGGM